MVGAGPFSSSKVVLLRSRVSVDELGFVGAENADLNNDGFVDASDIRAFAELHDIKLLPEFNRKLAQIERGERKAATRVNKGAAAGSR